MKSKDTTTEQLIKDDTVDSVEEYKFEPIKGYPMLNWKGKRPFRSTNYFPAQLKENHGQPVDDWMNEIYWGDNLQVMSHLLKKYRGKVQLIYIDPPFDSTAEYKKKISLKGKNVENDHSAFEEKQYTDIWSNDEYLQFMYERLILMKELLADTGSIYVHSDYRKAHHVQCIMDEIFGEDMMQNEIVWCYRGMAVSKTHYVRRHDNILFYSKKGEHSFNWADIAEEFTESTKSKYKHQDKDGRRFRLHGRNITGSPIQNITDCDIKWLETNPELVRVDYLDEKEGVKPRDWVVEDYINIWSNERVHYPTQKPEFILERIIKASSNPGDLVFDCFMGSGTTQAVAMKLGRKFIGADINLGAIQTTTKRLLNIASDLEAKAAASAETEKQGSLIPDDDGEAAPAEEIISTFYTGFSVYNVNNYDVFRNPVQAKELLVQALELQPLPGNSLYDGEKDGRMVKIMPVNRIATRVDLNELITGFDYKTFKKRAEEHPNKPVEHLTLVCMGHEPGLQAELKRAVPHELDVEIIDILRDKTELTFKRDSEARISIKKGMLVIDAFYPMNLLNKLSIEKEKVDDWRELTESVMIDFNYDGAVFEPAVVDVPGKNELVEGSYPVPEDAGTIMVKITDLLSESIEVEVENG